MKILNLYSGIGGNRKLWGEEHEITAVEWDKDIAKIYQDFFPNDKVVVADAHKYLEKHFQEFDFIWSSPPCPTHSRIRKCFVGVDNDGQNPPVIPEMKLYGEILFLQHYFKGKFCVENVMAFYKPLIPPQEFEYHWWWTNFLIPPLETGKSREHYGSIEALQERKGFNLDGYKVDKRIALRNCVEPETGKFILDCAMGRQRQKPLL